MKKYYFILMFTFLLIWPAVLHASSPEVVIHSLQIAGQAGSTDEFVGLKNISTHDIDLNGYTLVKKTQTGTSWSTLVNFPAVIINPGQILLVAHSNYVGDADLRYTSSSYSIASDNSVALRDQAKVIIDLVGIGDASNFEGAAAPNPASGDRLVRKSDADSDNNNEDFMLVASRDDNITDPNVSEILISEIMPNPKEGKEWFELYNPTSQPIGLLGLKVCDGLGAVRCYSFKKDDVLGSFEYKIYTQDITKITLNNSGDYLEVLGSGDESLASTENYGDTERGYSLSLFGTSLKWTFTPTPNAANLYSEEPIEEEKVTSKKASTKKTSVVKVSSKTTPAQKNTSAENASEVLGAETAGKESAAESSGDKISNKQLGIGLMALSIVLLLGYNLWLKKDEIREIYYKFRNRNH